MQISKIDSRQFAPLLDEIFKSLFQKEFSIIECNLKIALRFGYSVSSLFEIILCDFMKGIKNWSDISVKFVALKNSMKALEYLGVLYMKESSNVKRRLMC
ncbi:MAG: hypothetical protein KAU58_04795, partial [Candidatus Omnitrophica bacterium]|nr:hypothetical protein [Candidatus Omnitrophota bacterium]